MMPYAAVELELLRNTLESVVDEMALTVVRTAYSTTLKNAMDFSTGLCDPDGNLIAQGLCIPMHIGSLPDGLSAVLNRYRGSIADGDLFILNDPYEGGAHLPDIYLYKPVFIAGDLLGFVSVIAHHTDIGGRVAGGNACDSTEIYQEGLRIPPLRLYEAGKPVRALFDLIDRNVRVSHRVLGDLRAQLAACHIGEREVRKLSARHGKDRLKAGFDQLLDYAERLTRAEIAAFPDGVYPFTDLIDDDGIDPGPIPITVTITVSGDRLTADFEGTAKQVRGAINCTRSTTKSVVYAGLRCLMRSDIPTNSGFFRAVEVRIPSGCLLNPVLPAPVAARGMTGMRTASVVLGALAQVAPDRVPACEGGGDSGIGISGYRADRTPFSFLEFLLGCRGGRPDRDGVDGCSSIVANTANNPVEVVEADHPVQILRYGFLPDSGGPGKYRGGLAIVREYRFLEAEATLQIRADRHRARPYGLSGGGPGAHSQSVLTSGGETRVLPSKTLLTLKRDDTLHHTLSGAGGYGDPFTRDPSKVLDDVLNEKVTPAAAERDYGVAVDPGTWTVDLARTESLRKKKRA